MGSSISKYEDVALTTNVLSTLCKWCAKVSRYFFKSADFKYPNSKFTEVSQTEFSEVTPFENIRTDNK